MLSSGCGGGGGSVGGGGAEEPPIGGTPESAIPLAINEGSRQPAFQVVTIYSEALQALAYDTLRWAERFSASPAAAVSWPCQGAGSVALTWTDADRNGVLNAGDELRFELAQCLAPASDTQYSGSIRMTLTPPRASGALAARVDLPNGLTFSADSIVAAWRGAFTVERAIVGRGEEMIVGAAAADRLRLEFRTPTVLAIERLENVNLWRAVIPDWQGTATNYAVTLASDLLRGRVVLSTTLDLFAYFDTYPMQGTLVLTGNGQASLRARLGAASPIFADSADAVGVPGLPWRDLMPGFAWIGPGPLPQQYQAVREVSAVPFNYVGGAATTLVDPVERTAEWQFNRALRNTPAITAAQLQRAGDGWGLPSIHAAVETSGGRVRLRWSEQLEPGASYAVQWLDSNSQPTVPYGFARLGAFGEENASIGVPAVLTAANSVSANVSAPSNALLLPGSTLRLNSAAFGSAPLRYRWSQVDGVPVQLATTDQPTVEVGIANSPGAAPSDVTLQLEVVDSRGVVDRQTTRLRAVPSPSTSILTQLRGSAGDPLLGGATVSAAQPTYTAARLASGSSLFVHAFLGLGAPINGGSVFLFVPAGAPLQPGTYVAPVDAVNRGNGPGILLIPGSGGTCSGPGSFTIYEVLIGPDDGSADGLPIAQLAADFILSCGNGSPTITGSVRIASPRPLPS